MDICVCNFWVLIGPSLEHSAMAYRDWPLSETKNYPDNVRKTETIKVTEGKVLEFKAFDIEHDNQYSHPKLGWL